MSTTFPPFTAAQLVGDPVIAALGKLLDAAPDAMWCGSWTDLLADLNARATEDLRRNRHFWPHSPIALSRRLNRMEDGLRAAGLVLNRRHRAACLTRAPALAA